MQHKEIFDAKQVIRSNVYCN